MKKAFINIGMQHALSTLNGLMFMECAKDGFENIGMNAMQRFIHLSGGINWTNTTTACDEITQGFYDQIAKKLKLETKLEQSTQPIHEKFLVPAIGTAATVIDDILIKNGLVKQHYMSDLFSAGYAAYSVAEPISKLCAFYETPDSYDVNVNKVFFSPIQCAVGGLSMFALKHIFGMGDSIAASRNQAKKLVEYNKHLSRITDGKINFDNAVKTSFYVDQVLSLPSKIAAATLMRLEKFQKGGEFDPMTMFKQAFGCLGILIGERFSSHIIRKMILNNVGTNTNDVLTDKVNAIISSSDLLLKGSADTEVTSYLQNMSSDMQCITSQTQDIITAQSNLLTSIIKISEIDSAGVAWFEALDNSQSINISSKKTKVLQKELENKKANVDMLMQSILGQPRTVVERGALDFYVPQVQKESLELADLQKKVANENSSYTLQTLFSTVISLFGIMTKSYDLTQLGGILGEKCKANVDSLNKVTESFQLDIDSENLNALSPDFQLKFSESLKALEAAPTSLNNLLSDIALKFPKSVINALQTIDAINAKNSASEQISKLDDVGISLENLDKLFTFMANVQNSSYVKYYTNPFIDGVRLQKMKVNINGLDKLCIEDLKLEYGKHYLMTGKSGCGKTTFFSSIFGLPNFCDAITVKGSVTYGVGDYGKSPVIIQLTQNDNFPANVTLLDAIIYPNIISDDQKSKYLPLIERLMIEVQGLDPNIPSDSLNEELQYGLITRLHETQQNVYTSFSGGQKKKLALVGLTFNAMYKTGMIDIYFDQISQGKSHNESISIAKSKSSTALLLLDEIYNGLDDISKQNAIKLIKSYTPNKAVTITIEHQPKLDCYDYRININDNIDFFDLKTGSCITLNSEFDDTVCVAEFSQEC